MRYWGVLDLHLDSHPIAIHTHEWLITLGGKVGEPSGQVGAVLLKMSCVRLASLDPS